MFLQGNKMPLDFLRHCMLGGSNNMNNQPYFTNSYIVYDALQNFPAYF